MTEYIDDMGKTVMVSQGIGDLWFACRVKKSGSLQRVKSKFLPERDTQEEAQTDLDHHAAEMGWKKRPPPQPPPEGDNGGKIMKTHELRIWPDYFTALVDGKKPFEVRYNDRDYKVGDVLKLQEYIPADARYTGREVQMRVTYIWTWREFGLLKNWVVMGLVFTGNIKL